MSPTENLLLDTPPPSSPDRPAFGPRAPGRDHRVMKAVIGAGLVGVWLLSGPLLGVGFVGVVLVGVVLLTALQTVLLRRPVRSLLVHDTASFARGWVGKVSVVATLFVVPVAMLLPSVAGGRYGRYADDSWKTLLMVVVLVATYLLTRRLLVTMLVAAATVGIASWVMSPALADDRNGEQTVLAHLDQQGGRGNLAGYHDVAVAEVDLDAAQPTQLAGIGADGATVMEVGSMTKAMTGLVIADAMRRREIRMDAPVATYLPQLDGSPAGSVTMAELVTHTAGYAEFGGTTLRGASWRAPLGRNFFTADHSQMTHETREQTLADRGTFGYSTLGAATAGQAVAAAAHMSYADLMRTRLFEPLGMSHTAVQGGHALVPGGRSQTGLPVQPWVMDAYAPGGGVVSTTGDLARLATALLDGSAPGTAALEPTTATDQSNSRIGGFWTISTWQTGQTVTHHAGQTGGYAAYLGLDRSGHKAVIVLSDVANDAGDLGSQLLADRD